MPGDTSIIQSPSSNAFLSLNLYLFLSAPSFLLYSSPFLLTRFNLYDFSLLLNCAFGVAP